MSLRTVFQLNRLRNNLHRRPSELKEMQTRKLRSILRDACANVPFYRKKFKEAGVEPDDIRCIEDLEKIPFTSKIELQSASFREIVASNISLDKCVRRRTSGSIGQPLTIIVDRGAARIEQALWLRAFLENGLKLGDTIVDVHDPGTIFMESSNWLQNLGIMRREHVSIFEDVENQLRQLEQLKPDVIKGYPSALTAIAYLCEKEKTCTIRPRLIFTGAELLDKATRKFIGSVFGAKVLDNYGCSEFALLAWECGHSMGYHMNLESVIIEFIDEDEQVSYGEPGEVVCTSLVNQAMPLIRYRLGDIGVPSEEECSCGRTLPLMKVVEGRTDDFLVTLEGKIISPLLFFPYPFENFEWITQFRIIQEKRDQLKVQLVVKEGSKNVSRLLEKARLELVKLFGAGMQVEFEMLESIERDSSGKLRKIISRVPIDNHFGKSIGLFSPDTYIDSVAKKGNRRGV